MRHPLAAVALAATLALTGCTVVAPLPAPGRKPGTLTISPTEPCDPTMTYPSAQQCLPLGEEHYLWHQDRDARLAVTSATVNPSSSGTVVQVTLDSRSGDVLAEFTRAHTGAHLLLVADRKAVAAPLVGGVIPGGTLEIGGLPDARAREVVAAIMG